MLDLLAAWALFPAVALAVCAGLGAGVERLSGQRLPGALLLPLGMAALLAVTQLPASYDPVAEATAPGVVVLAAVGAWLGRRRLLAGRPLTWAAVAAAGVFAVLGAPVLLSGAATFAGYTILGDTSIHFIGADALLEHGRDFSSLAPSSYEFSLEAYYGDNGYPSGGAVVAGVLATLAKQDVAWTFQPLLALFVAFAALSLWSLIGRHVEPRWLRALVVFVAAQPALVIAYALQGSIKEVGTVLGVALLAALVAPYVALANPGARAGIPLSVTAAALVALIGPVAVLWVAPLCAGALVAVLVAGAELRGRRLAGTIATFVGLVVVLSLPSVLDVLSYVEVAGAVVTSQKEVGNLLQPLKNAQIFGIWLTGDYRLPPAEKLGITYALVGVAGAAALLGGLWLVRRRAWEVLGYVAVSLAAFAFVTWRGSPWADGKALMIASPAVVLTAMIGGVALWELRRRIEAIAVAGLVGAGVLWSNALAYHDVSLAPRDRLAELDRIGDRIAGEGPTLYPEFEEFAKHFLREADPEGTAEGWQRRFDEAFADGSVTAPLFGVSSDLDRFTTRYVTYYRTIVLRRGPFGSRPPVGYERVWSGRWYDAWQRSREAPEVLEHLPLGLGRQPSGVVSRPVCREIGKMGRRAAEARWALAYVERPLNVVWTPTEAQHSPNWYADPADPAVLRTVGRGGAWGEIDVPRDGRFELWLEGSFGRRMTVRIDGRPMASVKSAINGRQTPEVLGRVQLSAGRHTVEVVSAGGDLRPGNGGSNRIVGPLMLTRVDVGDLAVQRMPPRRWRELCGRTLDWVELVRPAATRSNSGPG